MFFASPIWLVGLLPWAAVVVYLLPGRGTLAVVPFLWLWKNSAVISRRPARRRPSLSILLVLLSLLLALLAAAKPSVTVGAAVGGHVTIILDRGSTMAVPPDSARFLGVLRRCADRLGDLSSGVDVTLIPVPGRPIELTGVNWLAAAEELPPTVLPVQLDQTIANQLRKSSGPVIVLTDQKIDLTDQRIAQIPPEPAAATVAITAIAARSLPHPQAMVRIENRSDRNTIHLTISSGEVTAQRDVPLPAFGQSIDQFVDLPSLGPNVAAELAPHTTMDAWSIAGVVQQPSGVRIAVDPSLDDAVKRIAAIYAKDRPTAADAPQILVSSHALAVDQPGIWVQDASTGSTESSSVGRSSEENANVEHRTSNFKRRSEESAFERILSDDCGLSPPLSSFFASTLDVGRSTFDVRRFNASQPTIAPSDLTRNITAWPAASSTQSPPDGFSPLVSIRAAAILATRDQPTRQIWLNADLIDWEKTPDFVIFFSNAFAWLSTGDQRYTSVPPGELGDCWQTIGSTSLPPGLNPGEWPGVYQSTTTGRRIAVNAGPYPVVDEAPIAQSNPASRAVAQRPLGSAATIAALAFLLAAVAAWDHRSSANKA